MSQYCDQLSTCILNNAYHYLNLKNYLNRLGTHRSESKHLYSFAVQLM